MISLGAEVKFHCVQVSDSGNMAHVSHLQGTVVGRTREAQPRYDIRVKTTIFSNIPTSDIEGERDA